MSKFEIEMPASAFKDLTTIIAKRTDQAKSIIIEDDGFFFKIFTKDYQGNKVIAGYISHPNPIQQKATGSG